MQEHQTPLTPRAVFGAALVSALLAPFLYGLVGGDASAAVGFQLMALGPGLPLVAIVFIAAWILGSFLRLRRIRHIVAFAACGAALGSCAPALVWLWIFAKADGIALAWAIPFSSYAWGALAGALDGVVFWLAAQILSRWRAPAKAL